MGVVGEFIESHDSLLMYHGAQQRHITWAQVRSPEETLEDLHVQDRGFLGAGGAPGARKDLYIPGCPLPHARGALAYLAAPAAGRGA